MLNKTFFVALAVAVVVMGALTFLAYSQLQSIGFAPSTIVVNFERYEGFYWQALIGFALILLILANVLLWTQKRAWALWLTFLFAAVFIMIESWWLSEILFEYRRSNNLSQSRFSLAGIAGALLCAGLAAAAFANQFLVFRLRARMYPQEELAATGAPVIAGGAVASENFETENDVIGSANRDS